MQPTPIIVFGAPGRVGARVCELASTDPSFTLIAAVARASSPRIGQPVRGVEPRSTRFINPQKARENSVFPGTVVVDFSSDDGAREALALALDLNAALLVGTTALPPSTLGLLHAAAPRIPLLITPNTAIGVAVLAAAVSAAARVLGRRFDCSIVESHHRLKKDSPSGTALRLADAARNAGAVIENNQVVSIRGGDVVGEHTVRFAGDGEYLEFTHRATSRDVFARGALHAAQWLSGRAPGLYSIEDVLDLAAR
jgi:4-hydroxy-tetrahydrodipicolinate reductase